MKIYRSEKGDINVLLIPLIMTAILLLGSLGFGIWAFAERTDYKENSDQKAAAAAAIAVEQAKTEKDNEFVEKEKEPLTTYSSALQYGSFTLKYPKTWSVYADEQEDQLTMFMHPGVVSAADNTSYALRVEVLSTPYDQVISEIEDDISQGKAKATAYSLPKVPSIVGMRVDGQVNEEKNGAAIYMPLRDKTIKLATETQERLGDFNNFILPNFEFKP